MRLPLILASALLITLVAGGVLYTWYSTGPVEVTISSQGSSNPAIELVQVSEGYAPDREYGTVHGTCGHLDVAVGGTERTAFGRLADAELMLRVTPEAGPTRRYVIRYYLSHVRPLSIRVEMADGQLIGARVRPGRSGTFDETRWDEI